VLRGQEVNLDVVIYDSLECPPAGFNAQSLTNLLIYYQLSFGSYHISQSITP